jgi:nitrogenase molybdenum-iron protein alpha/beta subunit
MTKPSKDSIRVYRVMLYVGGLLHVTPSEPEDLGMEIIGTGYEFGHKDDYERTKEYQRRRSGSAI